MKGRLLAVGLINSEKHLPCHTGQNDSFITQVSWSCSAVRIVEEEISRFWLWVRLISLVCDALIISADCFKYHSFPNMVKVFLKWNEFSFYYCNSLTFNIVYCRSCRFFEQFILTTAHSTHQSKHVSHQPIVCSIQSFHSLCNAADHHNGLMANQACIHRKYGHVRALSSRNWANGLGISVWGLVS